MQDVRHLKSTSLFSDKIMQEEMLSRTLDSHLYCPAEINRINRSFCRVESRVSLKFRKCDENENHSILKELNNIPNLIYLDLSLERNNSILNASSAYHNTTHSISVEAYFILSCLKHASLLSTLILSKFMLCDQGAKLLSMGLINTPKLTFLDVSNHNCSAVGVEHLARGLRHIPLLSSLLLQSADDKPGVEGELAVPSQVPTAPPTEWTHLWASFRHTPSLTSLDVGGPRFADDAATRLAAALAATPLLVHLGVRGHRASRAGAQALCRALARLPFLTSLDLSQGKHSELDPLGDAVAALLIAARPRIAPLSRLALANCGLTAAGASTFLEGPGTSCLRPELAHLDLGGSRMGRGAGLLMRLLAPCTRLAFLSLRSSCLLAPGALAVAEGLRHPCLTSLDLAWNAMGDAGAARVAGALRSVPALARLDLGGNLIGDDGAAALAEAVGRAGSALTALDVGRNRVGLGGLELLVAAQRRLPWLDHLEIRCALSAPPKAAAPRGSDRVGRAWFAVQNVRAA